jgi:hypothetical protein
MPEFSLWKSPEPVLMTATAHNPGKFSLAKSEFGKEILSKRNPAWPRPRTPDTGKLDEVM